MQGGFGGLSEGVDAARSSRRLLRCPDHVDGSVAVIRAYDDQVGVRERPRRGEQVFDPLARRDSADVEDDRCRIRNSELGA
jgi:hypothetical protein